VKSGRLRSGKAQRGFISRCKFNNRRQLTVEVITEEVKQIEGYILEKWKQFSTIKEVRLCTLFPEPENPGLKHIWMYGSADLVVYRSQKPICIIEAGGYHHWEEKQSRNDRRKWKLADENGVKCLQMMNGMMGSLSRRKWRALLGAYLFEVQPEIYIKKLERR
jgi:hypothetical protein